MEDLLSIPAAVVLAPSLGGAAFNAGNQAWREHKTEEALARYVEACTLDPVLVPAHLGRARCLERRSVQQPERPQRSGTYDRKGQGTPPTMIQFARTGFGGFIDVTLFGSAATFGSTIAFNLPADGVAVPMA